MVRLSLTYVSGKGPGNWADMKETNRRIRTMNQTILQLTGLFNPANYLQPRSIIERICQPDEEPRECWKVRRSWHALRKNLLNLSIYRKDEEMSVLSRFE